MQTTLNLNKIVALTCYQKMKFLTPHVLLGMSGIGTSIITHDLNIDPLVKPIA